MLYFSQENGDRIYQLGNGNVKLHSTSLKFLKFWNHRYPNVLYDSKYLKKIAVDVFGMDCLAKSSVGGTFARSARIRREPLDVTKLNFVRGNEIIIVSKRL